jgi:hypothetical protein
MKQPTLSLLFCSLIAFLFFSCGRGGWDNEERNAASNEAPRHLIPEATATPPGSEQESPGNNGVPDDALIPRIELGAGDILVQVININLDLDPMEEQILVLKERENPQGFLRVAVIDYDSVLNVYRKSWEGVTQATNIRNFVVDFIDVVGDLNENIVCTGIDQAGRQRMDVFWRTTAPNGVLLYYAPICSLSVKGRLKSRSPRSRAYRLKQKTGKSFPIITYQHDPDSQNIMDLLKTVYFWDFQIRSYVAGDVERIPGQKIEDQQLRDLYRTGEAEFEQFLSGGWLKTTSSESPTLDYHSLILFDHIERRITFFSNQVQESYIWDNSNRTLTNSISVFGTNEIVPYIKKQIMIRVLSLSMIQIAGTDIWQGIYTKVTPAIQASVLEMHQEPPSLMPSLSGYYRSDTGDELHFSAPLFAGKESGKEIRGGFAVFTLGNHILSLKILNEKGLVAETRTYKFDYFEETDATTLKRILYLLRGDITVSGFRPTSDTVLRFEQVEIIEPEE